jgi:(4S)-4-hydroxy-5-phosphonooxypentane-2,3-dione isomerase
MNTFDRRQFLNAAGSGLTALGLFAATSARADDTPSDQIGSRNIAAYATELAKGAYFLMIAEWELKPGNIERAKHIIGEYRPHILSADGIKIFLAAQDTSDPNHILFYEAYESEAHYTAHAASDAFQKYIVQEGLPLVAKRTLTRYHLI